MADLTDLFIIEPAEYTATKPLCGRFRRDIRGENTNVNGTVVIPLHFRTKCGGRHVRSLGYDEHHGRIARKFVHTHTLGRLGNGTRRFAVTHRNVVGLPVARRGRKTCAFQHGIEFFGLYGTSRIVAATGLSVLGNFGKIHRALPSLFSHHTTPRGKMQEERYCTK